MDFDDTYYWEPEPGDAEYDDEYGDYWYSDDDYYDFDDDDSGYDSYDFDNPYNSYDYDDYYSDGIYDEDDYESDGKGGWSFSIGGVPDTLKDFATGLAGNYAQQSIGNKYWKKRTDYEEALRAKWFDIENKYNSPRAMAARLRAAGLNPALILGGSGGAGAMAASAGRRSSAGGSSVALGSPITSPSKLAELNVMDSIANKNNADAARAQSDVVHNSFMNRLADAQVGVQNALAGLHGSQKEGQDIQNNMQKLAYAALTSVHNVLVGGDSDGNEYYMEVRGYMTDIIKDVLEISSRSINNNALASNIPALIKSVGDGFALIGENLRAARGDANVKQIAGEIAFSNRNWSEYADMFQSVGGPQMVSSIVSALITAFSKGGVVKGIAETIVDSNGEVTGGSTREFIR